MNQVSCRKRQMWSHRRKDRWLREENYNKRNCCKAWLVMQETDMLGKIIKTRRKLRNKQDTHTHTQCWDPSQQLSTLSSGSFRQACFWLISLTPFWFQANTKEDRRVNHHCVCNDSAGIINIAQKILIIIWQQYSLTALLSFLYINKDISTINWCRKGAKCWYL